MKFIIKKFSTGDTIINATTKEVCKILQVKPNHYYVDSIIDGHSIGKGFLSVKESQLFTLKKNNSLFCLYK